MGFGQKIAPFLNVKNLLFLVFHFLSASAFAEGSSHLGFYLVTHLSIPAPVQQASSSVFRIVVPSFEGHSLNTFQIPSDAYSQFKKRFSNYKNMDLASRKVIAAQIQFCDQQKMHSCQIFLNTHTATGFMMNGIFWTNAHVVESYLDQLQNLQQALLVFIFNQKDELVLNPYLNSIFLKKMPALNERAQQRGSFYSEETDFVGLETTKFLGPSLEMSPLQNGTTSSEDLYIPGFAACTQCQKIHVLSDSNDSLDRSPFPNSTGEGLRITKGPSLNLPEAAAALQISFESLTHLAGQGLMFMDSDSRQGMSGAPILNGNGQVVGIFSGGKTTSENGKLRRISRGIKVQQLIH